MTSDTLNIGPALGQRPTAIRPIIVKRNIFDCWEVQGLCSCKDGYPVAKIKAQWDRVYRFSYRKFKGPIGAGLCVRHVCDNRLCVNPEHLILGSNADNVRDRVQRKGR